MDPYIITPAERARFEQQFLSLNPQNGIVTGDQAKGFLLQSQLPPAILGIIWALADTDADGKMNINEFSIACKLINLKLRGFEIPKTLPPALQALASQPPVLTAVSKPPIPPLPSVIPTGGTVLPPGLGGVAASLSGIPPPRPPPAHISPPSGGPSPIFGGAAPPIPPLPTQLTGGGSKVGATGGLPTLPTIPPLVPLQPLANAQELPPLPPTPMPTTTSAHILPPSLGHPAVPPSTLIGLVGPTQTSPPSQPTPPTPPIQVSQQRSGSIAELGVSASPLVEWAVPQASKLKYTQLFNTTDKNRTGFLTGVQARNILLASKLPQPILAQIWALADMDTDGRLSCEEFVLALHLCDMARAGETLPTSLPPNLVPPTLRRVRQNSVGSNSGSPGGDMGDPLAGISQVTFEDKRKENFEKGQAELDRRRKALLEIQRKEQEERERKEREEREKQEKIRLEQERKRQEEIERELERTRELEKVREEERRRAEEQREAARKEMERQRQLEWENNRRQELENQRRKEQEAVLALKAKNQALAIELSQKEDKVKEISKQISETRCGVTSVKSIIDGMRQTRDVNLAEYNKLKALLKQRNQQLVTLSQQKAKLESQGKLGGKDSADDVVAFNNKTIIVKNLKEKVANLQEEVDHKKADLENNNAQLKSLRDELKGYLKDCEELFDVYAAKRNKMLELKDAHRVDTWGDTAWNAAPTAATTSWPAEAETEDKPGYAKYRALYEFVARNTDELSFQPGDTILVPTNQNAEPGWLSGELRGMSGWFPESYVEPMDSAEVGNVVVSPPIVAKTPLEGIAEVGENLSESGSGFGEEKWPESTPAVQAEISVTEQAPIAGALPPEQQEYYEALYSYNSEEPGDLTFEQGDKILVVGMDGDWWTGVFRDRTGIFPSNYVQKCPGQATSVVPATIASISPAPSASSQQPSPTPQLEDKTPQLESKISPTTIEPQITGGSRVVTPDFSALASQIESGGEESDSKGKGKKPLIATVIAPYQATSSEQLSLQRGQLIMIRKKTATGWWEGELQAKGKKRQIGWFPASYVKLLAGSGRSSQTHSRKTSESGISDGLLERVVALYPYTAQNEDELSFEKDDVVTILAKDEPSWWKGECKGCVGLFPSNYVGPISESNSFNFDPEFIETYQNDHTDRSSTSTTASVDSPSDPVVNGVRLKITKEEKRRQQCIKELILTEQAYIDDMSIVHDVFEKPLLESNIVTSEQFTTIFINWHDIIECNRAFLRSLRVRRSMSKGGIIRMIGDILCENIPRMTVYVRFCSCQLRAASTLQLLTETRQDFQALVKKCQADPRTQGLPLSSFLIKPMQRITKYPLLISKILHHTPSNHPDRSYLEEALAKAEELCSQINEGVREKENSERLEWLQMHVLPADNLSEPLVFNSLTNALGPRKFLHHGILVKAKSGKELVGFLMNDFLLLAQPNRSLGTFNFERHKNVLFKLYKKPLLLNETTILASDNTDTPELKLEHKQTSYNLLCPNINEKHLWVRKLSQAQSDMRRLESEKFSRQQSIRQRKPKFIMFVIVLNAKNLDVKYRLKKGGREVLCEASMGAQEQRTPPVHMASSSEIVFNSSMQFLVKDLNEDVLCLTVKEKGNFSPDQFLGRTELRVSDILLDTGVSRDSIVKGRRGPVTKQLKLQEVTTGVVNVKLDLHLFHQNE